MENVKITQLHWTLTPETHKDLESRVRKDAAREAIRKARDYADVCGDGKGGRVEAVWIKEWEAFTRLERNRAHVGKERVGVVQKSEWDYEPVDVGVEGRVDGKFVVGG